LALTGAFSTPPEALICAPTYFIIVLVSEVKLLMMIYKSLVTLNNITKTIILCLYYKFEKVSGY